MRKVTCYECEKRYDYDDDGFCPRCGAFNLPTSTSRIGADGSVVWVDGLNERNHHNSFLHDELHQEDRQRRRLKLDRDPPEKTAQKPDVKLRSPISPAGGGRKKGTASLIWVILGLVICVNFILPLLFALVSHW